MSPLNTDMNNYTTASKVSELFSEYHTRKTCLNGPSDEKERCRNICALPQTTLKDITDAKNPKADPTADSPPTRIRQSSLKCVGLGRKWHAQPPRCVQPKRDQLIHPQARPGSPPVQPEVGLRPTSSPEIVRKTGIETNGPRGPRSNPGPADRAPWIDLQVVTV